MNLIKMNPSDPWKLKAGITASVLFVFPQTQAAELTLKAEKFQQVLTLDAVALPTVATEISIKPKKWGGFKIEKVLAQGSVVKKGDTLIWIETEGLDKAIEASEKSRVLEKLQLEAAQQGLAELVQSTPISLESAQRKFDRYQQNYEYYKTTVKPNIIDSAFYSVERAKNGLSYQMEELKQLQMMYKEDGLTEETEEIILQRTKNRVVGYQRDLKEIQRKAEFTTGVEVPRKDVDWENGAKSAQTSLESTKKTLQRNLKMKQEEVAKLVADDDRKQEYLDDLKTDRKLMDFKSPVNGVVHYGQFLKGKWHSERASKILNIGGTVPSRSTVMSIVPSDTKYQFNAFLKESEKDLFSETHSARLKLKKNLWVNYKAEAQPAPTYPNLQHQWLVRFTADEAVVNGVVTGSKATISVMTASADNVISIPTNSVTEQPDGTFTVKLKMAEGQPKETPVKLGRESAGKIEITGGVEAGQVIITPEK